MHVAQKEQRSVACDFFLFCPLDEFDIRVTREKFVSHMSASIAYHRQESCFHGLFRFDSSFTRSFIEILDNLLHPFSICLILTPSEFANSRLFLPVRYLPTLVCSYPFGICQLSSVLTPLGFASFRLQLPLRDLPTLVYSYPYHIC